jgi:hypothetical protein
MKQILIIVLISILFIGCGQEKQTEVSNDSTQLPYDIQILTIDGCQYIKATAGYSGATGDAAMVSIIHKANCPNHGDTAETK